MAVRRLLCFLQRVPRLRNHLIPQLSRLPQNRHAYVVVDSCNSDDIDLAYAMGDDSVAGGLATGGVEIRAFGRHINMATFLGSIFRKTVPVLLGMDHFLWNLQLFAHG